jgi:hypothetical protein
MAIVVSEYGKVLGLVTMDDLLAQIFGVFRDERTDLQLSNPGIKIAAARGSRTPAPGVPTPPAAEAALDPPAPQPIFRDEVTPVAIDIDDIKRQGQGSKR